MNNTIVEMLVDSIDLHARAARCLTFEDWKRFMGCSILLLQDQKYYLTSHRDVYFPQSK